MSKKVRASKLNNSKRLLSYYLIFMATSFVPPLSKLNNSKRLLSYYIIFHGHIIYTTAFQTIFAPENFRL